LNATYDLVIVGAGSAGLSAGERWPWSTACARVGCMPSKVLIEAADEGHIAVLGAGLCTPAGEHMAHLLALAPGRGMTVRELLRLPCYHPLLEEGLRSPVLDGHAVLAALDNPSAIFDAGEAPALSPQLTLLDPDGNGLRALSWIPALDGYLLIGRFSAAHVACAGAPGRATAGTAIRTRFRTPSADIPAARSASPRRAGSTRPRHKCRKPG
jgi:hypothetical protein